MGLFFPSVLLILCLCGTAFGARFDIRPVKVFFGPQAKIEKLIIKNSGEDSLTLQIKAFEWRMDDNGADSYSETRDIILFPKMVTLKKDEEKIVRLGTNLQTGPREKTYRIFVEEIPSAEKEEIQGTLLRMQLKVGIPVFFSPSVKEDKGEMDPVRLEKGKLTIKVKNTGNVHYLIQSVRIKGEGAAGREVFSQGFSGWYVLAGAGRTYEVSIPPEVCRQIHRFQVEVKTQADKVWADQFAVNSETCERVR
jgi:fimbrial chaperone protein